ncbi:MAG: dihydrodipicolinate synthase family protein [Microbacterium sp.]
MTPAELKNKLHGITGISITPFTADGALDLKGYEKNLRFLIDGGLNASNSVLVVGGSTGECGAMTTDERKELIEAAIDIAAGDLLIVAGCNSTNIREAGALAAHASEAGAAGVMALAPYYYPAKDSRSILSFYSELAASTDLGILMYNNIEVMGLDMPRSVLRELAEIENIVGLKECTPAFFKMTRVVQEIGADVAVVNGHGEFLEPFAALAGTAGFISSIANFAPQKSVDIWNARSAGDYAKAKEIRDTLTPYMDLAVRFSEEGGEYKVISLLKYVTDLVGSCGGFPRVPAPTLNDEERGLARAALTSIGLI